MRYVRRIMGVQLLRAAKAFPSVVLTGPRRAGKTMLLRRSFPEASYFLFEDPDVVARFRADPQGFLDSMPLPAILDEVQYVPEVFRYVRARIDAHPRRTGQWFLTGSQEAGLMRNVTESMAGRAAVLQMWPMSAQETKKVSLLHGGYPEVIARPREARLWFSSYLQTYIERDVRTMTAVQDLATFRRFFSLVASRHGQVLNRSDLAAPLGVSVPTVQRWLDVLETTGQILLLPPFYESFGKRLVKSPKLYVADSGLACHLLGIESETELKKSPFRGALFEGLVAAELVKQQTNAGLRREVYWFRDQQGLEVDFVVPTKGGGLRLIEAKAGSTVRPEACVPMQRLANAIEKAGRRGTVEMLLAHEPAKAAKPGAIGVAEGVSAVSWRDLAAT